MAIFLNSDISQGSVVTQLRCDGIINKGFVANLLMSLLVKEFLKSVNIWRSYMQYYSGLFFIDSQCSLLQLFFFDYNRLWDKHGCVLITCVIYEIQMLFVDHTLPMHKLHCSYFYVYSQMYIYTGWSPVHHADATVQYKVKWFSPKFSQNSWD